MKNNSEQVIQMEVVYEVDQIVICLHNMAIRLQKVPQPHQGLPDRDLSLHEKLRISADSLSNIVRELKNVARTA